MTLYRLTKPRVSLELIPFYVPNNQTRLEIGWELFKRLRDKPEDTFCLAAVEDTLRAMVIAYVWKGDCHIWQAYAEPGFEYSKLMFDRLISWAKEKGLTKLTTGTKRPRAMCRKWGFVQKDGQLVRLL